MAAAARRDFDDALQLMLYEDSSENSSSSDKEDLDDLFVGLMFRPIFRPNYPRLNLEDISNVRCESMFRFPKDDMERLHRRFADSSLLYATGTTGMEALMILLRRLAYPSRWCDLEPIFGRSIFELSLIFNEIMDDIHNRFHHLLDSLDLVWLDLEVFAQVIHDKGAPLNDCWGFVDGMPRPIARPIRNQRIMFSGHKRIHLKFQSVQAPNGIIAHMYGPIEGRRHDAFMLGESGLLDKLRRFEKPNGYPYIIYGDPAYGLTHNIMSPFRGAHLTDDEHKFKT